MAAQKTIPPLRKKTAAERGLNPNSLTAALFWDTLTDEALEEARVTQPAADEAKNESGAKA